MTDAIDSYPGERGDLWQDTSLFEIYNTHRDVLREAHAIIIKRVLDSNVSTDGMIAEIGSGSGHLYSLLPESYKPRIIGIERTLSFAAMQKRKFQESAVVVGDAYSLPIADNSVKAVLSYSVYDTFQDLEMAVAETARVLQRGGNFIHFLDLQPNYGILIKDIPYDQIPFPVYKNGVFDRFALISRRDYESKMRSIIDPRKVMLFDIYVKDPVNTLCLLEISHSDDVIKNMADTVAGITSVERTETSTMKDRFKDKLVEELKKNGFRIVSDKDMCESIDVTPNSSHKKNVGKNLFEGNVGHLWTKFDLSVPFDKVREKATLQVLVAEKS